MKTRLSTLPTVHAVGTAADRTGLLAALQFVDEALQWTLTDLAAWLRDDVAPGRMPPPSTVCEAVVGTIALDPRSAGPGPHRASAADLPKLLAMARSRVLVTLRAFLSPAADDRFLHGAIFVGRVQRVVVGRQSVWAARPQETDKLSDILLSLFAADILMHRESYERDLCVCNRCGRISFHPRLAGRYGCPEHKGSVRASGRHRAGRSSHPPRRRA